MHYFFQIFFALINNILNINIITNTQQMHIMHIYATIIDFLDKEETETTKHACKYSDKSIIFAKKQDPKMKQEEYNMVTVFQSQDLGKIYLAHNQLQNSGVDSFIKNEFRAYNIGYIELQVHQKDVEQALHLLGELFPEEFVRKIICPHCGSDQVHISSTAHNRFLKKIQVGIQQLKYQLLRELPKGTYRCENCQELFSYPHSSKDK